MMSAKMVTRPKTEETMDIEVGVSIYTLRGDEITRYLEAFTNGVAPTKAIIYAKDPFQVTD